MPAYTFRGAHRADDGVISDPLFEESLFALDLQDAIQIASMREHALDERVNAMWLLDEHGMVRWTLRRADRG